MEQCQSNIGKFQNLFGSKNFIVVDNNNAKEMYSTEYSNQLENLQLKRSIITFAKQWIDNQLRMKKLSKGWLKKYVNNGVDCLGGTPFLNTLKKEQCKRIGIAL